MLTKSQYGIVSGLVAGIALAYWQWRRSNADARQAEHENRGEVIFSNTPHPAGM